MPEAVSLQVLHRKEAAVGAYFLWHSLDRLHHGKQRSIVGGRLCHTLLDDQMILAETSTVYPKVKPRRSRRKRLSGSVREMCRCRALFNCSRREGISASRSWRRVISSFFSSNPDASLGGQACCQRIRDGFAPARRADAPSSPPGSARRSPPRGSNRSLHAPGVPTPPRAPTPPLACRSLSARPCCRRNWFSVQKSGVAPAAK